MTVRIVEDACFKDDYGYPVTLDTEIDVTGATSVKIKVIKPDDSLAEWSSYVYGTTKIRHILVSGELNLAGTYYLNAFALNGTTWQRMGDTFVLTVLNQGERLDG